MVWQLGSHRLLVGAFQFVLHKPLVLLDNQLTLLVFLFQVLYEHSLFSNLFAQGIDSRGASLNFALIALNMPLEVLNDDFAAEVFVFVGTLFVGIAADARIQVVASQNQDGNDPDPHHQDDERADGAIKHIVARKIGDINVEPDRAKDEKTCGQNRTWTENHEVAIQCLTLRAFAFALHAIVFLIRIVAEKIKQGNAQTKGENANHPTQHAEQEEGERATLDDFVPHEIDQRRAAQRNQQDGDEQQQADDDQHKDGKSPLKEPAFQVQALVGHIVGIHIAETVEDGHHATGAENQAEEDTQRQQSFVWLVHDPIDGIPYIIHCPRGDKEVVQGHHHPFVEMRDGNVGYQREEKQDKREKRQEEIEGHASGTIHGAAFGEQLDEVNQYVQKRHLGAREMHLAHEIVVAVVPCPQRFVLFLEPNNELPRFLFLLIRHKQNFTLQK